MVRQCAGAEAAGSLMPSPPYPGNREFAFSVIDDTDDARLENIVPLYDLLTELGLRTTKTVWP